MKQRKRTSIIWTTKEEDFIKIVAESKTIGEILSKFGLKNKGGNPRTLKERIKFLDLNTSHILIGYRVLKYKPIRKLVPLVDVLTTNSSFARTHLKKRLLKDRLLEEKCYECGIGPIYNNKPLSLQIDHINGISNDNRLENLRLVCPNCHSQTDTFAGKNKKYSEVV